MRGPDSTAHKSGRERRSIEHDTWSENGVSRRIINDMRLRLLSVASLMEALASTSLFPPRIPLHPFTRVYHACDCARSRHVPSHKLAAQLRNVSFSTYATMAPELSEPRGREDDPRVHTCPTIAIRTHPAHPSNSLRTRDTRAPCVCVTRVVARLRATCASPPRRGHTYAEETRTCRPAYHLIAISVSSFVNI